MLLHAWRHLNAPLHCDCSLSIYHLHFEVDQLSIYLAMSFPRIYVHFPCAIITDQDKLEILTTSITLVQQLNLNNVNIGRVPKNIIM